MSPEQDGYGKVSTSGLQGPLLFIPSAAPTQKVHTRPCNSYPDTSIQPGRNTQTKKRQGDSRHSEVKRCPGTWGFLPTRGDPCPWQRSSCPGEPSPLRVCVPICRCHDEDASHSATIYVLSPSMATPSSQAQGRPTLLSLPLQPGSAGTSPSPKEHTREMGPPWCASPLLSCTIHV